MSNQSQQLSPNPLIPSHIHTAVSRTNREVEQALQKRLSAVTKGILVQTKKQKDARWTYIFGYLKPALDSIVHDSIRSAVNDSYTLGANYAVKAIDKRKPFYLTEHDIEIITNITDKYVTSYWNRIETSFNSKVIQDNPNEILHPAYVDQPVAISTATEALALGTSTKAEALLLDPHRRSVPAVRTGQRSVSQSAETPTKITPSILRSRSQTIATVQGFLQRQIRTEEALAQGLPAMQFIWLTANNACPNYCDPLRGITWYVGQPFPFHPPMHPNCRCRLFLIRVST